MPHTGVVGGLFGLKAGGLAGVAAPAVPFLRASICCAHSGDVRFNPGPSRPSLRARLNTCTGALGEGMKHATFLGAWAMATQRPVQDRTGLRGAFDFDLEWTADVRALSAAATATADAGTSIFTALQEQLGLKLENTRGPVPVVVIDRVERPKPD